MMTHRTFLACLLLVGATALAQADQGNPKLKSIEAIRFGPNGLLLIGGGSTVVTVETGDVKETTWSKTEIADIDQLLAGKLGLTAKDIQVQKIAVNPASHKAYVVVRSLKSNQYVILTVDGSGTVAEFSLENVKYNSYPLAVKAKAVTKITDIAWVGDRIVAATQATDTFKESRVFTIIPGSKDPATSISTKTYHVGHGRWETEAPLICLMPYQEKGKSGVVGSFTCTPIVKYPIEDGKPDTQIQGTSVLELGTGNTPRSMFTYEKNGKKYILVNAARNNKKTAFGTSAYWAARVDFDLLDETKNVNEKALWRIKGKNFEPATDRVAIAQEYYGVHQMDKLDATRALVIRDDKGAFSLRVLQLP